MWLPIVLLVVLVAIIANITYGAYKVVVLDTKKYAAYWLARSNESVPNNAVRVIALGDSTFQAIGASKPQFGTVGRIVTYLEKQTGRPVHITNISVSGAKAVDVAEKQLPLADFSKSDIVVLAVGANDAIKLSNLDVFRTSMSTIVSSVPAEKTIMADVALVKHRKEYQKILTEARASRNIHRADLTISFKQATQAWRMTARDFFHPSDYGYEFWFKAFEPELDEFISDHNLRK